MSFLLFFIINYQTIYNNESFNQKNQARDGGVLPH